MSGHFFAKSQVATKFTNEIRSIVIGHCASEYSSLFVCSELTSENFCSYVYTRSKGLLRISTTRQPTIEGPSLGEGPLSAADSFKKSQKISSIVTVHGKCSCELMFENFC